MDSTIMKIYDNIISQSECKGVHTSMCVYVCMYVYTNNKYLCLLLFICTSC